MMVMMTMIWKREAVDIWNVGLWRICETRGGMSGIASPARQSYRVLHRPMVSDDGINRIRTEHPK